MTATKLPLLPAVLLMQPVAEKAIVQEIRFRGVQRRFRGTSFTDLDIDDWTYWTTAVFLT